MSAIYGFVNLDKHPIDPDLLSRMRKPFFQYPFDDHREVIAEHCVFGCFKQSITIESVDEVLPYCDESSGCIIVADAILDNRLELMRALAIEWEAAAPSDSCVILEAYKRWGEACVEHLLGDFAFVIYDAVSDQIFVCRDHMGNRTLYYTAIEGRFAFSTTMEPLLKLINRPFAQSLQEQWLVDFLSIPNIYHEIDPELTVYKDIFHVLPAHYMILRLGCIQTKQYWNPLAIKRETRWDEKACHEEFNAIFRDAVNCRLRTRGEVGSTLSGGLDSSSVACTAADLLSRCGKPLKTYTAVPTAHYQDCLQAHLIADESPSVLLMKARHPNMDVHLVDSKDTDSYQVVPELLRVMEQPYKFVENSYWLYDINKLASQNGCKVLLGGQFGNATISSGDYQQHHYQQLLRFRWRELYESITTYCRQFRIPRKRYCAIFGRTIMSNFFYRERGSYSNKIVNTSALKEFNVEKRMVKAGFTRKTLLTLSEVNKIYLSHFSLNHLAAAETKIGLRFNLIMRDPTRDKRVVEFCLRAHENAFVHGGQDRALVRKTMKGIVPDEILENRQFKGKQSADWLQRIEPFWDIILQTVARYKEYNACLSRILSDEDVELLLRKNRKHSHSALKAVECRTIHVLLNVIEFMNRIEGGGEKSLESEMDQTECSGTRCQNDRDELDWRRK